MIVGGLYIVSRYQALFHQLLLIPFFFYSRWALFGTGNLYQCPPSHGGICRFFSSIETRRSERLGPRPPLAQASIRAYKWFIDAARCSARLHSLGSSPPRAPSVLCVVKLTHRFDLRLLELRRHIRRHTRPFRGLSAASPVRGLACAASMALGSMVTRMV